MKKILVKLSGIMLLSLLMLHSCKKDDLAPIVSEGKEISYFNILEPGVGGILDTVNKNIKIIVPPGTSVTELVTDISIAPGYSITPASGTAQDFSTPIVYTINRPNKTTTTWIVTVFFSEITVTSNIEKSTTWIPNISYIINNDIQVNNNAVLTIKPGTTIKFGPEGSLIIGKASNGTLIANGTIENPIKFTSSALSPTAGDWDGLVFYDKTTSNTSLYYSNIEFAGRNYSSAICLYGADISMNNCTVSYISNYGIDASYDSYTRKGGFITFENNKLINTKECGLRINVAKLNTIGSSNTFINAKGISLEENIMGQLLPQTWKNLKVPYIIEGRMHVQASLTIAPGTTIKFEKGTRLYLDGTLGISPIFIADGGSANTPITFTSTLENPVAGSWDGLILDKVSKDSKMNFCIVDYAGKAFTYGPESDKGAISAYSSTISFNNNTVRNSNGYGIYLSGSSRFSSFNNNSISNCADHLILISTHHLPDLGSQNRFAPAPGKGLELSGDAAYQYATWKNLGADYYFVMGGNYYIDGILTIEPGCTINMSPYACLMFGTTADTKITAVGSSTDKITFKSSSRWTGLYFGSKTLSTSALGNCEIMKTGNNNKVGIYTEVSFPVNNTNITDYLTPHAAEYKTGTTAPPGTGNNFTWFPN